MKRTELHTHIPNNTYTHIYMYLMEIHIPNNRYNSRTGHVEHSQIYWQHQFMSDESLAQPNEIRQVNSNKSK